MRRVHIVEAEGVGNRRPGRRVVCFKVLRHGFMVLTQCFADEQSKGRGGLHASLMARVAEGVAGMSLRPRKVPAHRGGSAKGEGEADRWVNIGPDQGRDPRGSKRT